MPATITPQEFVSKWSMINLTERAASQTHFNDLCAVLGVTAPLDADPTGQFYTFEKGVAKGTSGGQGWADVWKHRFFAWEYKRNKANLNKAYEQLQLYRESLENPPLLVVSDNNIIEVHTNFTNTVKKIYRFGLDDLLEPKKLDLLRCVFTNPEEFRTPTTTSEVTERAAKEFSLLAELLRKQGIEPARASHFLIRLLFCLFAEDVGLLPPELFSRVVQSSANRPVKFEWQLRQLFSAMRTGGFFGEHDILHFNGGLFDSEDLLQLDVKGLDILLRVSKLDWSSIEPAIFGTLFERSLDPAKRAQLGAHYTSRADILLIVEPVLMLPLRRRWAEVQKQANALKLNRDAATGAQRTRLERDLASLLVGFNEEIGQVRVLDPACGSGNFLYVALKQLLDLQKEIAVFAETVGLPRPFPTVSPQQLYGIEVNEYAHELAQATVWIGYIQWLRDNGFGQPPEPILKPLHNILNMDAVLAYDAQGHLTEPVWPSADIIIGNPPFLGGNKVRQELGNAYVDNLFALYDGRVPAFADLVCYWFERARALIEAKHVKRAGLLATNSIRGGVNRRVLERIKHSGDIFMAWSDRSWVLNGAAVRVSMIGFDDNSEQTRELDGNPTSKINADLTSSVNLGMAKQLQENGRICFRSDEKGGSFDISTKLAHEMLKAPINPNGRPNSDVVRPYLNALDVVRRPRGMWIIDFGVNTSIEDAALYELPFQHVEKYVKPERATNNIPRLRDKWWIHRIPGADMREVIGNLDRFIVTPSVAKHRLFVWLEKGTIPDHQLYIFARDDDYFFGVLHSKLHEIWSLRMCTWLGVGNDPRYTPTTCFETFPFPWSPGKEPEGDGRGEAIAQAARELVQKRDNWLNPAGADEATLKKHTLTNLYNDYPKWLEIAHEKLDKAVLAAYGWPADLTNEQILERLLALNQARA